MYASLLIDNSIEAPRAGNALQLVLAALVEGDTRAGHQILDGSRNQDVARRRSRRDPCADGDRDSPELAVDALALSVWRPARISSPRLRTSSRIAHAASIARPGPSNAAKKPSPAVSSSSPRCRARRPRTTAWWRASSSRQAESPTSAAFRVEPTISVKRIVARTRSGSRAATRPRDEPLRFVDRQLVGGVIRPRVRVSKPHELDDLACGIRCFTYSAGPTMLGRWRISVGTRIADSTSLTSASAVIR